MNMNPLVGIGAFAEFDTYAIYKGVAFARVSWFNFAYKVYDSKANKWKPISSVNMVGYIGSNIPTWFADEKKALGAQYPNQKILKLK